MEAKSCITVNCQQRSSGYRDWVILWLDTASQFPFYWKHSRRLVNCWKSARSANVSRKKNKKQTRHNRLYSNWLCGSIRLPRGHFQRTRQCQDALMHKNEKAIYTTLTWAFVQSNQRVWNKKMRKQKKKKWHMMDQDFNSTSKSRRTGLFLSNAERMKRYSEEGAVLQTANTRAWFYSVKIGIDRRVQGHVCASSKLFV